MAQREFKYFTASQRFREEKIGSITHKRARLLRMGHQRVAAGLAFIGKNQAQILIQPRHPRGRIGIGQDRCQHRNFIEEPQAVIQRHLHQQAVLPEERQQLNG